ncbi:DoxX family protein [Modestobacter sp. I12A-02662]|uniref:DoxX family protein n=1 Tax=Modestobacter sp. I12A-02662 TaxID=1730496 RepID=UPI0034DFDDD1
MLALYVAVTVVTALANAGFAGADFKRASFVLANSAQVGVPTSWLPWLGALKAAGAVGLLIGLFGTLVEVAVLQVLGVAAAAGLVLFFTGALITHVRAGVLCNLYFPGGCWLSAAASLALAYVHLP